MRFFLALLLLCCAGSIAAADIPVRDFFEHRQFSAMKISPDGKHVAFTYQEETEVKLGVMRLRDQSVISSFGFGNNMHVLNFYWANDERVLMEVAEITGNLVSMQGISTDLYAANIDGSRRTLIFAKRNDGILYSIMHMLPQQKDRILIARYNLRDKTGWRAFTLDINRGRERYLDDQPAGIVVGLIADNSGNVRVGIEAIEGKSFDDNRTVIHYKKDNSWQKLDVPTKRKNPSISPLGFSADNSKAYFSSNHDIAEGEGDVAGVFQYDFATSELTLLARHSFSDVGSVIRGSDGEVLAVNFATSSSDLELLNAEHPETKLFAGLQNAFPDQVLSFTSFDREGNTVLFNVKNDRNPGDFYLFDVKKGQARYLASALGKIKPAQMQPMREISFTARDGKIIRGLLTMPAGKTEGVPLIVNVHGGPFGIYDSWGFDNEAQFFASRGYATLQINFRGSGGYGDDFYRAGRLQWGRSMQDDVTDGTLWAIEQGITDKDRVCIYGGSYGGYAALWGVIKEPDLYKCSVGYVGVYDMPLFFSGDGSDASRNPSIGQYLKAHVGEGEEYLRSISPVHHVDKIKAELFIVHGSKDVRVPIVHANNLRKALDSIGKPYEWLVKEDGHGFFNVDNREALYTQMLAFFDKHIGKDAKQ